MKYFSYLLLFLTPFAASAQGLDERINDMFAPVADAWEALVLTSIPITETIQIPIILILLIGGATFFTFYFNFVNIRRFPLAIRVVQGKYDFVEKDAEEVQPNEDLITRGDDIVETIKIEGREGEVSHFQALTAAISGTVGLGNIAGVAVAISMGGPGATFWMIIAGLLGMSSKFVECTLGVKYRDISAEGKVFGGPMYYLSKGLKESGKATLGKILAVMFAIMCVGGSFGGGNMFQANQAAQQFNSMIGTTSTWAGVGFGIVMSVLVAVVIIGGIKRIAKITEKVVPFMVGIYFIAAIIILFVHF